MDYEAKIVADGDSVMLRWLEIKDAEALYQMTQSEELTRFLSFGALPSVDAARKFISDTWKKIDAGVDYTYGIEWKEQNKLIGSVHFPTVDRENGQVEIGIWLGQDYWGKNLSQEPLRLMISYGFNELGFHRIWAKISTENLPSLKAFKKQGFIQEEVLRKSMKKENKYLDMVVLSISRNEKGLYNQ